VVSVTAHASQQLDGIGFGALAKSLGANPGQAIQAYDAGFCDG
jgi:hypothetical protein